LIKIVCFGDSLTCGARDEYHRNYPMELSAIIHEETGKFACCLNYGISGQTTSQMFDRAYAVLNPHRDAKLMLFMGGTNDCKIPIPETIYRQNVEGIVMMSRELGIEPCIGFLPPIYGTGLPAYSQRDGNARLNGYNAILSEIKQTWNLCSCDFRSYSEECFCDGVHMNHRGYVRMAHDWFQKIGGLL
jgi:lysophospholipase L1-like esterase